jgi:hypothetical protein
MCENSRSRDIEEALRPKSVPWRNFEQEVAEYIEKSLSLYSLGIRPDRAKVHRAQKYYSKEREGDVTFDVALEVFSSESDTTPVLKWVWECKDYPTHKVSVNEIEVFADQMRQVGAHKGTMVTRMGYQEGAINLATSRGIGLMVLRKEEQFYLAFSQDAGIMSQIEIPTSFCLYTFGDLVEGPNLDEAIEFELNRLGFEIE